MSNKILLIGNSGLKHHGVDGQTAKVRLYLKKVQDEGFEAEFVDLEGFLKHPLSVLHRIKRGIIECNRIVLISAKRGCKYLIPFINKWNKKFHKKFILPLVGTSVLHYSIDKLTNEQKEDFISNGNYELCLVDSRTKKQLEKIDFILPETDLVTNVFKGYYNLENVYTLNNFRDLTEKSVIKDDKTNSLNLVFLSRVMGEKGIFDLMDVVNNLSKKYPITLDIYGHSCLNKEEKALFNKYLNDTIKYCGIVDFNRVVHTISKYDLFVFPTRFVGEGTPGVIAESFIAGIPVLTSNFPQAKYLMNNGENSIFYKMFDKEDLRSKLLYVIENKNILAKLHEGAKASGKKYLYEAERNKFLKYVCGVDIDNN